MNHWYLMGELARQHQERLLAEARNERLAREGRPPAKTSQIAGLVGRLTARRWAAALRIRTRASPLRTLASYTGSACHEAGVTGTLTLVTLPDGRRVLACQPAAEAM